VQNGPLVFRAPSGIPGVVGPVTIAINPNENFFEARLEGLDYEATYILESSIFGHADYGRLTFTLNGTWLSRAQFTPGFNGEDKIGIAGSSVLGNSFPWNRANFTVYYDGPPDTWMQGLDAGAVVHWIGQYNDATDRNISAWTTFDLILNYTFNLSPPGPTEVPGFAKDGGKIGEMKGGKEKNAVPASTAEYNRCGWRGWLNNTTISLGLQNVLDADPPFVADSFENGYDESLATIKGRFWYVQVKKRF
jgi:hypothetical protein